MRKLLTLLALLAGCAATAQDRPYVTVMPVGQVNETAWFADGPQMACTAHNPWPASIVGRLTCRGSDTSVLVDLGPGEDKAVGFCQVMNSEVHAEPCSITPVVLFDDGRP